MKNYKIKLQLQDLELTVSNMYITCYGAVSLLDFNYHLTLELKTFQGGTIITQEMSDDIAFLIAFCNNESLKSSTNNCLLSLDMLSDNDCWVQFQTEDCKFFKKSFAHPNLIDDFRFELKSYYQTLIENYSINNQ